ncbi:hypothetical protein [Streptomyces sp. NPDC002104]
MGSKHGWTADRDLVVRCLAEAAALWQAGEWTISPPERAAASATGLTAAPVYGYPSLPAHGPTANLLVPSSWLQRAGRLAALAGPLCSVTRSLPARGPLPMLLGAAADLCDHLREDVDLLDTQWALDTTGDWQTWELAAVSDDLWRKADAIDIVVGRLSRFLGVILIAD